MKYLVDANVLSEPTKREPNAKVVEWLRSNTMEIAVDPFVLGELEYGILLRGKGKARRELEKWFESLARSLVVIDFDAQSAHVWAETLARVRRNGTPIPVKDSLIAATALRYDLTVSTRNVEDFRATGVRIVNPFEEG